MASVVAVHACVNMCVYTAEKTEYPCVEVFVKGLLLGVVG